MSLAIDHFIIAARTRDEGIAALETALPSAKMVIGGQHIRMGTHNALLNLGGGIYIEVIAPDPSLPRPSRPRWFSLDEATMQERLEKGPHLIHWAVRTNSIAETTKLTSLLGPIESMQRGDLKWLITIPEDGKLPMDGCLPTVLEWQRGGHPCERLPASEWALSNFSISHPKPEIISPFMRDVQQGSPLLSITLRRTDGLERILTSASPI